MYYLISKDGAKVFYLLENHEYTVGRKDCDILIKDDTSISRKHASILIENECIKITDFGAKYKTFVNKVEIQPNVPIEINANDDIKFGILHNIYIVKEEKLNVVCSGIPAEEKRELSDCMKKLHGNILPNWSKDCSYLIVREIVLTLKMLCALIEGQPIVTIKFWKDFVKSVKRNSPPPNHNNYRPGYSESILNKNINFQYIPARKCLFKNKIFVFKTKASKARIECVIELAGGKCIRFNEMEVTKEKLSSPSPQYILVQDDLDIKNEKDSFTKMINYLYSIGKRTIPFQEIAMAIVLASCEKNCNPDFDRTGTLVKQEDEILYTQDIIAHNTETQSDEIDEKSSFIVPETVDEVIFNDPRELYEESSDAIIKDSLSINSTTTKTQQLNLIKDESQREKNISSVILVDNTVNLPRREAGTQKSIENSEEMEIKHEEIDDILNDSQDVNQLFAQGNNKKSNKIQNESNIMKRPGENIDKDAKRARVEKAKKDQEEKKSVNVSTLNSSKSTPELIRQNNEIVTSTQVDNSQPSTSKCDDQKQYTTNLFGFKRREVKECTSKTTAKVSDFFKPLQKPNQNADKSIDNISSIDTVTPSTSNRKRCSEEEMSSNRSAKKQYLNPFALSIGSKKKGLEDANPFTKFAKPTPKASKTESINPFADVRRNTRSKQTTVKTPQQDRFAMERAPYRYNITVVDSNTEKNYGWLSKNTIIKDETDSSLKTNDSNMDVQMQNFVKSFDDCVIIETRQLIVKRILQDKTNETSNKRNFKKFRKVEPLHMQTTIVPRANYIDIICNDSEAIDDTFYDDED